MKITTLTADELELTEGSTSGLIAGGAMVVVGCIAGFYLRAEHPMALWIGLGIAVIGVIVILFASSITVNAKKSTGQLRYQKKRLVGAQDTMYAIADVFRIETRKQWRMENTPSSNGQAAPVQQPMLVAQSVIVFKNGQELALDHQKTSSSQSFGSTIVMGGQGAETAMALQVAKFLNVPFQEIAPPNMSAGINIISEGPGGGSAQF